MINLQIKISHAWHDMHRPTRNATNKDSTHVCPEWKMENPNGKFNFTVWYEEQLKKLSQHDRVRLHRTDVNKDYSPDNCYLATYSGCRHSVNSRTKLTADVVVHARKMARKNNNINLGSYAAAVNVSTSTLMAAIIGKTWSIVDLIEPPVDLKK